MSLFNKGEMFEYEVIYLRNPSIDDIERFSDDDSKTKQVEKAKIYFSLMLSAYGEKGWELISIHDDTSTLGKFGNLKIKNNELIFKRSSFSKFYKTGRGFDSTQIRILADEKMEREHIN